MEFEEKLYAVGRIPGSFMRREGRPSARRAGQPPDRPAHAPLFPYDFRNDVHPVYRDERGLRLLPEVAAMIGASRLCELL